MSATWKHPKLGRFEFQNGLWGRIVDVPAFKAFSLKTGHDDPRRSTGKQPLSFWARGESDVPSAEAVAVALKVLADPDKLVAKIAEALWENLNGRGPDCGWHGQLKFVEETIRPRRKLGGPKDLLPLLALSELLVRRAEKGIPGYDRAAVEIQFHAAFEPEHGVSVLTDGEAILDIGHWLEVQIRDQPKRPRTESKSGSRGKT